MMPFVVWGVAICAVLAYWAAAAAAAGPAARKSARPASYATSTATGARTLGSCTTTSRGSTTATFATSARNPCQSGKA